MRKGFIERHWVGYLGISKYARYNGEILVSPTRYYHFTSKQHACCTLTDILYEEFFEQRFAPFIGRPPSIEELGGSRSQFHQEICPYCSENYTGERKVHLEIYNHNYINVHPMTHVSPDDNT